MAYTVWTSAGLTPFDRLMPACSDVPTCSRRPRTAITVEYSLDSLDFPYSLTHSGMKPRINTGAGSQTGSWDDGVHRGGSVQICQLMTKRDIPKLESIDSEQTFTEVTPIQPLAKFTAAHMSPIVPF